VDQCQKNKKKKSAKPQQEKEKPELKLVEIAASFSGKIETGRFSNENPFFSLKETWVGDVDVVSRQKLLSERCYSLFCECEQRSLVDRIVQQRKDIRFYDAGNGKKYPSITSIIGWDKDFFISSEDLAQYAARGTIVHKQIEIYLATGEWKDVQSIPELHKEHVVVKRGSLALNLDGYHIDQFVKKYELVTEDTETAVYNHDHAYAGRRDWKGVFLGKKTILDWKTSESIDKKYALAQLAAHILCPGNEDVEQGVAVPVSNKTEQGYSKPVIVTREELKPYFDLFLKARADFRYRFGV
jgi:hypothetical protein